jgi:signal transduction histidine kinase
MIATLTPEQAQEAYERRVRDLTEEIGRRDRQLAILSAVAARTHALEGVRAILEVGLDEILGGMSLSAGWVLMGDQASRKLQLAAWRGVARSYLEEVDREGLGECLCPEVFWTGHRMEARNTTQCPRMPTIVEGLKEPVAHACIPLRFEGETRGVLNIAARPGQRFSDDELRFLETVGHQMCVAIERSRHLADSRRAYDELKAAQQRLVQDERMILLGTFASGLAHEIRNPLNSIALQLSILERRLGKLEPEAAAGLEELAGIIRSEIRRLDALVGDFLLFSRTNRVSFAPASLEDLADEVMRLLHLEASQTGVRLERHPPVGAPIPAFPMDAEKMKQVVINLVRNAIEALPQGGTVVVETAAQDGRAELVVRDDGPGLPPGVDIFQLFVTTKDRGTGLGLSLAQQIVVSHGGEISAEDQPSGGAAFRVSLPLPAAAEKGAVR